MTTLEQEKDLESDTSMKHDSSDNNGDLPPQTSNPSESTGDQSAILRDTSKEESPNETPSPDLPKPPNGGSTAWIQCIGSFCLWFAVWGLVNSSGVYQAYYEDVLLTNSPSSSISWIGSLQLFLMIGGTSIIGPIFDRGYLRSLLLTGTFLIVFGLMMTSLCTAYWQFMLAQGVCMGLGMSCLFVPLVAVLPPYFTTRRALAMGIAASGSSIGAIIFAIMFQQLQPKIGFGWAIRCIGFVVLASLAFPLVTMRKLFTQSPPRALIDKSALKEWPFILTLPAMFLVFLGLYCPYFYIEVFSVQTHAASPEITQYLIVFMNAGSLFGRLLPNILADKVGPINTIITIAFITGAVGLSWIGVTAQPGIITFGVLYGFLSGSYVALTAVVWVALSPNLRVLGTRIAMMTIPQAAGLLIGNPIGGTLVNGSSFLGLQLFCGLTVMSSGFFLLGARWAQIKAGAGWKG